MDVPAMDPCPCTKSGRHEIGAVIPESSDGDLTFYCQRCCAIRRVPASGGLLAARLDDLDAERIRAAVGDTRWTS